MKTILIIEDEEIMLDLLQRKISASGYRVLIAGNGEEGLAILRKEKPDLIVMDLLMPKMDGFTMMKEVQRDEDLKKIPLIIVSNSGQPVELDEAKKLGARDWLIKAEFDPQELIDKIRVQLNER
ncbi:MAG: response regulator, partial [bacterium]|nr:response regulator [bacterium]